MLELRNVFYRYGTKYPFVLENINYTFESGRLYSITGESGAGKSTLISLLMGLDIPKKGDILFNGADLKKINPYKYRIRNVGLVFQGNNLILRQSAIDNVITSLYLGRTAQSDRKNKASMLLESVGISKEKHKRTILQLSGGEQQRVAIARAVANNPDIIIADEPTGNLDENNAEQIMNLLRNSVEKDKRCVILVTHNKSFATHADIKIKLTNGKLIDL